MATVHGFFKSRSPMERLGALAAAADAELGSLDPTAPLSRGYA
jgi:hypothetical protein